jgi:hypothetical protein
LGVEAQTVSLSNPVLPTLAVAGSGASNRIVRIAGRHRGPATGDIADDLSSFMDVIAAPDRHSAGENPGSATNLPVNPVSHQFVICHLDG